MLLVYQATRIHEEFFLPAEVIIEQGDVVDHLYIVCHGELVWLSKFNLNVFVRMCIFSIRTSRLEHTLFCLPVHFYFFLFNYMYIIHSFIYLSLKAEGTLEEKRTALIYS